MSSFEQTAEHLTANPLSYSVQLLFPETRITPFQLYEFDSRLDRNNVKPDSHRNPIDS